MKSFSDAWSIHESFLNFRFSATWIPLLLLKFFHWIPLLLSYKYLVKTSWGECEMLLFKSNVLPLCQSRKDMSGNFLLQSRLNIKFCWCVTFHVVCLGIWAGFLVGDVQGTMIWMGVHTLKDEILRYCKKKLSGGRISGGDGDVTSWGHRCDVTAEMDSGECWVRAKEMGWAGTMNSRRSGSKWRGDAEIQWRMSQMNYKLEDALQWVLMF